CSPIINMVACFGPSPKTVCVAFLYSGQAVHSFAAAATLARLFVSGTGAGRQLSCPFAAIFNYESYLDCELYVIDRRPRPTTAAPTQQNDPRNSTLNSASIRRR